MNCLECRELLHARLDGQPVAPFVGAIEDHLSECATCREQHAGAQLLLDGLKRLANPKPPARFAQSMVEQVMRDRRHRQDRMRRRVFATMALAASVLIMMMFAYYWLPRSAPVDPVQKEKFVKDHPKPEVPPLKVDPLVIPRENPQPNVLPERWAGTMRDHAKVMLAAANVDKLPPVEGLPVTPGVREAGQEVSVGVEAVTRSTRKAFDFFARELPMPDMGDH